MSERIGGVFRAQAGLEEEEEEEEEEPIHTFLPARIPQFCRSLLPRTAVAARTARGTGSTAAKMRMMMTDSEVSEGTGGLFRGNKNAFCPFVFWYGDMTGRTFWHVRLVIAMIGYK